jgi:hypothetical protein
MQDLASKFSPGYTPTISTTQFSGGVPGAVLVPGGDPNASLIVRTAARPLRPMARGAAGGFSMSEFCYCDLRMGPKKPR